MKHLGDITKISGYDVPTVSIIVGGSPCQDLSIAGGRKGLDGERSGLFMEQIRIIKEMREKEKKNGKTGNNIRPRYMVWENVPGAFSSNKGEDFRVVLEETAKVADETAVIPRPETNKWSTSGCILGEGPKYYLSAVACQGILRRAESRNKELPKMLKEALERQSHFKSVGANLVEEKES